MSEQCGRRVGSRPAWLGSDQYDPCECVRLRDHDGDCACDHDGPADAALVDAALVDARPAHGGCASCPRRWGPDWIDMWVPDEVWQQIAPNPNGQVDGSGHLCAHCIVGALTALRISEVPVEVYAAPLSQPAPAPGIQADLTSSPESTTAVPIEDLIERSSLGTPEAKAARATVSDERAARVVARAHQLEREEVERRHRLDWAEYFAQLGGNVGATPLTVQRVVEMLRWEHPPFGAAQGVPADGGGGR